MLDKIIELCDPMVSREIDYSKQKELNTPSEFRDYISSDIDLIEKTKTFLYMIDHTIPNSLRKDSEDSYQELKRLCKENEAILLLIKESTNIRKNTGREKLEELYNNVLETK